ncbi:DUF5133 domain-containing protein [Streptomyces griseus]|uniref:DUF5133 domain-containing protein n=1 Tax=Streptomyces griseus TaxID=1911 RepID=UPI0005684DD8|nr:DUF5133 domain-containing protein [Streptomyces griseus]
MLRPHPAVLRRLVEDYEASKAAEKTAHGSAPSPRAQDLAYTLCVSTGTRDVRLALETARRWLATTATAAERGQLTGATSGAE